MKLWDAVLKFPRGAKRSFSSRLSIGLVCMLLGGILSLRHGQAASALHHDHHVAAPTTFLGLNWWSSSDHRPPLGWFWVDFGLFAAGLVLAGRRPLERAFGDRHDHIRRAIAEAAAAHAKATAQQQEARRALLNLEAEVRAMEQQSRADGEAERDQLVHDAMARVAEAKKEAELQQGQQESRTMLRLRRQALMAVHRLAAERLETELTAEDQARLLERALNELETLPLVVSSTSQTQKVL